MSFRAKTVPVKAEPEAIIPALLAKAKAIYDQKEAPEGCKDCELRGWVVKGCY